MLLQHRTLLHVTSQNYCQVFIKSYNFIYEKIHMEGFTSEKSSNKAIFANNMLWGFFRHGGTPSSPRNPYVGKHPPNKLTFTTTSVLKLNVQLSLSTETNIFQAKKNHRRGHRLKISTTSFVCNVHTILSPSNPTANR